MTGVVTDFVIGTVTINLVDMMRQCRIPLAQQRGSASTGTTSMKMEGGIEVRMASDSTNSQTKASTEIVDNVKYCTTLTKSDSNDNKRNAEQEEDDDDPIVRVDIDEPIIKNGIETGRLQCQLEIWWTDGTITKAFTPHSSSSSNSNVGGRRRLNNRSKVSSSSKSDIAASNFQRRPPLVPDRRTTATTVN